MRIPSIDCKLINFIHSFIHSFIYSTNIKQFYKILNFYSEIQIGLEPLWKQINACGWGPIHLQSNTSISRNKQENIVMKLVNKNHQGTPKF